MCLHRQIPMYIGKSHDAPHNLWSAGKGYPSPTSPVDA